MYKYVRPNESIQKKFVVTSGTVYHTNLTGGVEAENFLRIAKKRPI